jgi:uncharacterized HAD superfamily protein
VEDRYDTACNLAKVCEQVYLFDKRYNQGELPSNVTRIAGWESLEKELTDEVVA